MKRIGYFQNLRNFLDISGNSLGGLFWRNFLGGFFWGGFFWEDFLDGILLEELISRN